MKKQIFFESSSRKRLLKTFKRFLEIKNLCIFKKIKSTFLQFLYMAFPAIFLLFIYTFSKNEKKLFLSTFECKSILNDEFELPLASDALLGVQFNVLFQATEMC